MIPFIAKYYLCDQFKTDEKSEAHRTSREEVKYVKKIWWGNLRE